MIAALIVSALLASEVLSPVPCATTSATGPQLYLDVASPAANDSEVTARVCLWTSGNAAVGSYHVTLHYDAALLSVKQVQQSPVGLHAVNSLNAGVVNIAGVAVSGFASGVLVTIRFHAAKPVASRFKLVLLEVNGRDGVDLRPLAHVAGYPAGDAQLGVMARADTTSDVIVASGPSPAPHVTSLSPRSGEVSSDAVTEIALRGSGFSRTDNTVTFGGATLGSVASADGVTLRFVVPAYLPAHGEVPPRRVTAGAYRVQVRTRGGESNAVTFTVRDEP